ncbi:Iron (Fe)-dependent peroxidase, partial [human gut metagenome]
FGAAMAGLAGFGAGRATAAEPVEHTALAYDFRGEHQAGILTPAQDTLYVAAFDVSTDDAQELKELIAAWTVAAEQMCAGELVGGEPDANEQLPPKDTGEAWGYPVSGL